MTMNNNEFESSVVENLEFSSAPKTNGLLSNFPRRAAMNIEFSNLTFSIQNGKKAGMKTILNGISGKFLSGQLTGIVGPSGAGKSTLLNILTGFRSNMVLGEILVNGKKRDLKSFRKKSCYIMQEDHLLPFLTVQELMESTSTLKLGTKISQKEKRITIADILESLSLKHCHLTRVANLSGGEKKRLSIALELINNPPVMFFDEPTSGLDSQNSYLCINLLKHLAQEGRTIVCTIHQPSARIFQMFDHLYAMSEGQCIYRSGISGLIPYLSSLNLDCPPYYNPADFLLEVASGEHGSFIPQLISSANEGWSSTSKIREFEPDEQAFLLQENNNKVYSLMKEDSKVDMAPCVNDLLTANQEEDCIPDYSVSFWIQFSVLLRRTSLAIIRDSILTKLRIGTHIIVGIFIGILYFDVGNEAKSVLSNIGCLYFCLLFHVFIAMMPTIISFPLEMKVFIREHLNHWYSLKAYYFAKTMADIPFQIAYSSMYVLLAYFLTKQPYEVDRFCYYMMISILVSLVAQTIGLAIGAALTVEQAVFFGPALTVPSLMFAGFFVTFSTIPAYLRWMTYFSYVRYGYEGSILAIYGRNRETLVCSDAFCMFKYPSKILELTEMAESSLWFDFLMLIIYFLVMRVVVYFILKWKVKKEQ